MNAPIYTLTQAAVELGVREDDLAALLQSAEIDLTERPAPNLTQPELDRLASLLEDAHAWHREGPFEGIDE